MKINSVGSSFRPYIYNTNIVSANSMNKIASIEDDVLKSTIDYSLDKNENPLKLGETTNFEELFAMQIQMAKNQAVRIMKPTESVEEIAGEQFVTSVIEKGKTIWDSDVSSIEGLETQDIDEMEMVQESRGNMEVQSIFEKIKEEVSFRKNIENNESTNRYTEDNRNLYIRKKAIAAYTFLL